MPRRRCQPLADTRRPHWLTVSDLHRKLISSEAIATGTDLRAAMQVALALYASEGWRADSDGAYGFTFIANGSERRLVNLTPVDPTASVGPGHAFLAGKGTISQSVLR
jgi:hypothetical protein